MTGPEATTLDDTLLASPAAAPGASGQIGRLVERYRPRLAGFAILLGYLLVLALLVRGWQSRGQPFLSAESGLGYTLGIVGGSMMLLLLLYPLRKRIRLLDGLGRIRHWFRLHMLLGVLGPVCILFHCSFRPGSLNSSVALLCMLLVAGSGLVGRYFYSHIHHGLYGQKATLAELHADAELLQQDLDGRLAQLPALLALLTRFEQRAMEPPASLLHGAWRYLSLGPYTWWCYLRFRGLLRRQWTGADPALRRRVSRQLGARLASIRKLTEFHLYERLFALWHVLHVPLFVMLVVSGIVHVFAVHMY